MDIVKAALTGDGKECVTGPYEPALKAFDRSKGPRIILMPTQTPQGFNELVRADTNIFISTSVRHEERTQAEARIARAGQTKKHVRHIDIAAYETKSMEVVQAVQAKDLSIERMRTIFR